MPRRKPPGATALFLADGKLRRAAAMMAAAPPRRRSLEVIALPRPDFDLSRAVRRAVPRRAEVCAISRGFYGG